MKIKYAHRNRGQLRDVAQADVPPAVVALAERLDREGFVGPWEQAFIPASATAFQFNHSQFNPCYVASFSPGVSR